LSTGYAVNGRLFSQNSSGKSEIFYYGSFEKSVLQTAELLRCRDDAYAYNNNAYYNNASYNHYYNYWYNDNRYRLLFLGL